MVAVRGYVTEAEEQVVGHLLLERQVPVVGDRRLEGPVRIVGKERLRRDRRGVRRRLRGRERIWIARAGVRVDEVDDGVTGGFSGHGGTDIDVGDEG